MPASLGLGLHTIPGSRSSIFALPDIWNPTCCLGVELMLFSVKILFESESLLWCVPSFQFLAGYEFHLLVLGYSLMVILSKVCSVVCSSLWIRTPYSAGQHLSLSSSCNMWNLTSRSLIQFSVVFVIMWSGMRFTLEPRTSAPANARFCPCSSQDMPSPTSCSRTQSNIFPFDSMLGRAACQDQHTPFLTSKWKRCLTSHLRLKINAALWQSMFMVCSPLNGHPLPSCSTCNIWIHTCLSRMKCSIIPCECVFRF